MSILVCIQKGKIHREHPATRGLPRKRVTMAIPTATLTHLQRRGGHLITHDLLLSTSLKTVKKSSEFLRDFANIQEYPGFSGLRRHLVASLPKCGVNGEEHSHPLSPGIWMNIKRILAHKDKSSSISEQKEK